MTGLEWQKKASKLLHGRTITKVRYISDEEMDILGWSNRCIAIVLDNDIMILPSMDDEGNGPGAIFTNDESLPTIPVL